jgi:CIC family chloride channel protein
MEDLFDNLKIPAYTKAAVGGLMIGMIGIFLPHIFGVGYNAIELALVDKLPWIVLLALIFMKIIATSLTIGSGGSGGIFAPSLFIGAMTGGAFGYLAHILFPSSTATAGAYSLVGMGAVVAATTHGPITAILILFEMSGDYRIILPLMLSCIISSVFASHLKKESIYTLKLTRRGVNIHEGREINIMKSLSVERAMTSTIETVPEDMTLKELIRYTMESKHSSFPVVDKQGLLTGILTFQDFKEIIFDKGLDDLIIAKDIATTELITITNQDNLETALKKIGFKNIEQLPVVDKNNPRKIIGILSRRDIFAAYNKALVDRSLTGKTSRDSKD